MESLDVRITGPGSAPYQLGQPMLMFAGDVFLGRVDPVRLANHGTEVHFGSFTPITVVEEEPRNVGALLFDEACAHIARFHPKVQQISFASSRPMPSLGDPALQAAARVATAERICATNIQVNPTQCRLIVVSGTWTYNQRNLRELDAALEEQRAIYREVAIGSSTKRHHWLERLRRSLIRQSHA